MLNHWTVITPGSCFADWYSLVSSKRAAAMAGSCVANGIALLAEVPEAEWAVWQTTLVDLASSAGSFGRHSLRQKGLR